MTQKMYLGPTVPGLARENIIFRDKLPEKVAERADVDVDFARLLVSMEEVMSARKQLAIQGSVLDVSYQNVLRSL